MKKIKVDISLIGTLTAEVDGVQDDSCHALTASLIERAGGSQKTTNKPEANRSAKTAKKSGQNLHRG